MISLPAMPAVRAAKVLRSNGRLLLTCQLSQASSWKRMLSTMVPSMSKISARAGLSLGIIWLTVVGFEQSSRRLGLDPPCGDVDARHDSFGEGYQHRAPVRRLDIEQVARAVILDRRDGSERRPIGADDGATDQIGMQELILILARGQLVARDEQLDAVQRFRLLARGHAL